MSFKSPKDTVGAIDAAGCAKANLTFGQLLTLGFLAGAFIAFGGLLAIVVGDGLPLPQKIPLARYGASGSRLWLSWPLVLNTVLPICSSFQWAFSMALR